MAWSSPLTMGRWLVGMKATQVGATSTVVLEYRPRAGSGSPPVIDLMRPSRSSLPSSGSLT